MASLCISHNSLHYIIQSLIALKENEVRKKRVFSEVISHNAAISACEKGDMWQLAHGLLLAERHAKLEMNVISFNALLGATEKASLWQRSLALLDGFQLQSLEEKYSSPRVHLSFHLHSISFNFISFNSLCKGPFQRRM